MFPVGIKCRTMYSDLLCLWRTLSITLNIFDNLICINEIILAVQFVFVPFLHFRCLWYALDFSFVMYLRALVTECHAKIRYAIYMQCICPVHWETPWRREFVVGRFSNAPSHPDLPRTPTLPESPPSFLLQSDTGIRWWKTVKKKLYFVTMRSH